MVETPGEMVSQEEEEMFPEVDTLGVDFQIPDWKDLEPSSGGEERRTELENFVLR